jgi:hypothetical protein
MSAYDMKFSDEIYGTAEDKRYASRGRLERMLEREFDLLVSRIKDHGPDESTFFFANTVAAQGFKKREKCRGWMGGYGFSRRRAPSPTTSFCICGCSTTPMSNSRTRSAFSAST